MRIRGPGQFRETNAFVGRGREREQLLIALRGGTGFLTITGPSGIGKTRLARRVASEIVADFEEGGVFFIDLSSSKSEEDVEAAIEHAMGAPLSNGEGRFEEIASRGRTLLVLDKAEGIAGNLGDFFAALLEGCVDLQLFATSIVPVAQGLETCFYLGPLNPKAGRALYLERAANASPGQEFSAEEDAAISDIVRRLDGIPLAIELAAARVRVLPPKAMLLRIDEGLEVISSKVRGSAGSLLKALSITWSLLTPGEQSFLAKASIFEGDFTADAAAGILGGGRSEDEVLDLLDGLRAKALIDVEGDAITRFSLLQTIRDFGKKMLEELGEREELILQHAAYYADRGEREVARLQGAEASQGVAWLKSERRNLAAAVRRVKDTEPRLAARAGLVLSWLLVAETFERSPDSDLITESLAAAMKTDDLELILRLESRYSRWLWDQDKLHEAVAFTDRTLEKLSRLDFPEIEARILIQRAAYHLRLDERTKAKPLLERALALGRSNDFPTVETLALMALSVDLLDQGDLEEGANLHQQALQILERNQIVLYEGYALLGLALIRRNQGLFNEARISLHKALDSARLMKSPFNEMDGLSLLAHIERLAGDFDKSETYARQGLEIGQAGGSSRILGFLHTTLGVVALFRGDPSRAASELGEAMARHAVVGNKRLEACCLQYLGVAQARLGRIDEAARSFEEANLLLVGCEDDAVWATRSTLEGCVEVARARALLSSDRAAAKELVANAQTRLEQPTVPRSQTALEMVEARRLLEQDLENWESTAVDPSNARPTTTLWVGRDGEWFERGDAPRVDLHRRVALRRMFKALLEKRIEDPGEGVESFELFASGWPRVDLHPEVALRRVYIGIWTLRNLGLDGILLSQSDGYFLDPSVGLERADP